MFVFHISDLQLIFAFNAPWNLTWLVDNFFRLLISETQMQAEQRCFCGLKEFLVLYLHAFMAELHDLLKDRLLPLLPRT